MRYLLLLSWLTLYFTSFAQTNRALIVAIGDYPSDSGWEKIHSDNDQAIILPMLLRHGYQKQNIEVLKDEQANKKKVIEALELLSEKTQPGDFIYLHFSCHGQQMMDDNGDEEDGLDESFILYDALYWYIPGKYEGKNHLRDDEVGVWIDKFRKKVGNKGQVVVVLDACHSGTGNRETEEIDYIRGTSAIFAPEGYVPRPGKNLKLSLKLRESMVKSPVVVFSACLPDEINYEYYAKNRKQYYGMLTYAFQELVNSSKNSMTIAAFMSELQKKVFSLIPYRKNRTQTPYMECSNKDIVFRINR